jgi:UDP-N-acetylglucosamine 2-epimerase (non-hydrolysing)
MKLDLIAGARPNFVKIAAIIHAIKNSKSKIDFRLIHTGQHYDENLSGNLFKDLQLPPPNINLNIGSGTQAEQTAAIMIAYERVLQLSKPNLCLVVGDVTSTMACSIVAKKLDTKVAHVEAGIRSWDLTMPEEINRMVTDSISDYYFTTSEVANQNLRDSGVKEDQIFFVGNVMIDTLLANQHRLTKPAIFDKLKLKEKKYFVLTMHRPANVDEENKLKSLMLEIVTNTHNLPIIFPIHPRTAKIFNDLGIKADNLYIVDPLGYLEFNYLVKHANAVITDSEGITEETSIMGVPCITLRDNTERPETITMGTNELIGTDPKAVKPAMEKLFAGEWKKEGEIPLWDGKTAERIVEVLVKTVLQPSEL